MFRVAAAAATRARPDLVPGVNPYMVNGGTLWVNPAAFSVPQPGTFGNLGRNALRGPGISQLDLTLSKSVGGDGKSQLQFRAECFNILNKAVFAVPGGGTPRLADATGTLQPGQAYTTSSAGGEFGALTSTVSNQVGPGHQPAVPVVAALELLRRAQKDGLGHG